MHTSKVYIIILNWNGWRDTLECLESVFRIEYPEFAVVVCDNGSTDGSVEQIEAWARGATLAGVRNPALAFLTVPPVPKPIPFLTIAAENLSNAAETPSALLTLIRIGGNLGFAAGNNLGLSFALLHRDCDLIWLLNNDTVVQPSALSALVLTMQQRKNAGMCGSTLLYYDVPEKVQALGGSTFNRWLARGGHIGTGQDRAAPRDAEWVEARMKFVTAASMLVRRALVEQVGLMRESYFLYFEEIDWATRARGRYSLAYAPQSIVYHREGATAIGTPVTKIKSSAVSDYYSSRSRMLYSRRYFPVACVGAAAALLAKSLLKFAAGNRTGAKAILRGLRDSLIETGMKR